jgi:transcriptional regulator with XRE-family HTH domain
VINWRWYPGDEWNCWNKLSTGLFCIFINFNQFHEVLMVRRTVAKYGPNPVDVHVGSRVRLRRTLLGMSQEKLGEALGLTFQQVQKYERGVNRIGSSRLFHLSQILDVSITFFFDKMPELGDDALPGLGEKKQQEFVPDPLAKRETLELVRAYYKISDPKARKRLFELTKAIAKMG